MLKMGSLLSKLPCADLFILFSQEKDPLRLQGCLGQDETQYSVQLTKQAKKCTSKAMHFTQNMKR